MQGLVELAPGQPIRTLRGLPGTVKDDEDQGLDHMKTALFHRYVYEKIERERPCSPRCSLTNDKPPR